jgi:hypothetical protein
LVSTSVADRQAEVRERFVELFFVLDKEERRSKLQRLANLVWMGAVWTRRRSSWKRDSCLAGRREDGSSKRIARERRRWGDREVSVEQELELEELEEDCQGKEEVRRRRGLCGERRRRGHELELEE